jgi:hypothetical protein
LDSLRAFFHPLPLWLVVCFLLFAFGVGLLVNLPSQWAGKAMEIFHRFFKDEKR